MTLHIVILAAGKGKRMYSAKPKVLHAIGGKPMLERVIETAEKLNPDKIHVIIGHEGEKIRQALTTVDVNWISQEQQLGTGHAVMQAMPFIPSSANMLVLSGDVPLIQEQTLKELIHLVEPHQGLALLTAKLENPSGLGRIMRNQHGSIYAIIEEKDATPEERKIREIYTGICCGPASKFKEWLPKLTSDNAQGEYYLTDIISLAGKEEFTIHAFSEVNPIEIQGINNRVQLENLERAFQIKMAEDLMHAGVTIADARRMDLRGELVCGRDVFIDVNNVFLGINQIGAGCTIGPNCVLKNVTLGENVEILSHSVLENCVIGDNCQIGPFARLRPGTQLASHCKIGNFVEAKNAVFSDHSKANHLSYLGDVTIGKEVNIGAGTITCNYDGANKHKTVIEDGAFIGSDTQLVAPVTIGENATIGAGSTIRKNVPAGELTLTVSTQKTVYGWTRPKKDLPQE